MSTHHGAGYLDAMFAMLERLAIAGERAPTVQGPNANITQAQNDAIQELARASRIRIEVSGRSWRTITILQGASAGRSTKPNPIPGSVTWLTIEGAATRTTKAARTKSADGGEPYHNLRPRSPIPMPPRPNCYPELERKLMAGRA